LRKGEGGQEGSRWVEAGELEVSDFRIANLDWDYLSIWRIQDEAGGEVGMRIARVGYDSIAGY